MAALVALRQTEAEVFARAMSATVGGLARSVVSVRSQRQCQTAGRIGEISGCKRIYALISAYKCNMTVDSKDSVSCHFKALEFSAWMTDTMHDAGDPTQHEAYRQGIARARLDELFRSQATARLDSDYQRGLA
jgi:hypothetical protein